MAWSLNGQLIETCSCNMFCPCWFAVPELMVMDQGFCTGLIAVRIQEGNSDGVAFGRRIVVLEAHWPGPTMFDGNGTARLFIDDGASADQRRALEPIFQGSKGGPMANLAPTIGTWLPMKTAKIDFSENGDSLAVTVKGAGELNSKLLRDSEGNSFTMRGGGFIGGMGLDGADLAPGAATKWTDADMPQKIETKSGARGNCSWSG